MKKFAVSIFLIGIVVAAAAIGIGIYVRDNPEVQAISAVTGIPITPDNGIALRQAALAGNLRMSGLVAFLLEVYPYISQATTIAAAVAATLQEVQQEQTKNTQTSENSERVDLSETAWKELLK